MEHESEEEHEAPLPYSHLNLPVEPRAPFTSRPKRSAHQEPPLLYLSFRVGIQYREGKLAGFRTQGYDLAD